MYYNESKALQKTDIHRQANSKLLQYLRSFLPENFPDDLDNQKRGIALIGLVFVSLLLSIIHFPLMFTTTSHFGRILVFSNMTITVALCIGALKLLKHSRSPLLVGNILAAVICFTVIVSVIFGGGALAPFFSLLLACPLLTFLIAGPRSALGWVILISSITLLFFALDTLQIRVPDFTNPEYRGTLRMSSYLSLSLGFSWLFYVIMLVEREFKHRLDKTQKELKVALIQKKEAKEEARLAVEANQAKSIFLATMNHELRTPLTAIIGFSELLLEEAEEYEEHKDMQLTDDLQSIHKSAMHLHQIIKDLLQISKTESYQVEIQEKEIQIEPFCTQLQESFTVAQKKNNQFTYSLLPPVLSLISDRQKLWQILSHLLGNAFKFTQNGQVDLIIQRRKAFPEEIKFSISDTGIGIPEDKLSSIFEPFVQADISTTKLHGGAGLGLAICKQLAELLGGRLEVDSKLGKGSTFSLFLPEQGQPDL